MKEIKLNLKENKKEIRLIAEALSSPTRLDIVDEIKKEKGEDSHRKLAEKLGIKSSSITFHLNSLIASGIVTEEEGRGLMGRKVKNPKLSINKIVIEL